MVKNTTMSRVDRMSRVGFISIWILLLYFCSIVHGLACDTGYIACKDGSGCTPYSYICDSHNDCGDNSDESFCVEWKTYSGCPDRGNAKCTRRGSSSCIPMIDYCNSTNPPCIGTIDPRICQILKEGELRPLAKVVLPKIPAPPTTTERSPLQQTHLQKSEELGLLLSRTVNVTLTSLECPIPFTSVGDKCLSFFYFIKVSWGEARAFCEAIGGDLITFAHDQEYFISLMKRLRNISQTSDFWIGGRNVNVTEGWSWLTGDIMELGAPFWAVRYINTCEERQEETGELGNAHWANSTACYHYQQAPRSKATETDLCAAMTFRHYHYITDEDCLALKSPLCRYTQPPPEQ